MTSPSLHVLDADATSNLLDYADMISDLKQACMDLEEGRIQAPERQMVEFPGGGTMLSMPATARDIGIHKLVNVMRDNPARNLPTIHGVVAVYDGITGAERCILHGQTITARRTTAVSILRLDMLLPRPPRHVAIVGYGTQALRHTQAGARPYPDARVTTTGRCLHARAGYAAPAPNPTRRLRGCRHPGTQSYTGGGPALPGCTRHHYGPQPVPGRPLCREKQGHWREACGGRPHPRGCRCGHHGHDKQYGFLRTDSHNRTPDCRRRCLSARHGRDQRPDSGWQPALCG